MRKFFIFLICLFSSIYSFGQENKSTLTTAFILKGSYLVGGSLAPSFKKFSSDRTNANRNIDRGSVFGLNLDTKLGYFFAEDLAIGGKINLAHVNFNSDTSKAGRENTRLLIGPFFRAYANNGIFGELGVGVGLDNTHGGTQSKLQDGTIGIGYTHFLNEKVTIEPMLSFRYSKQSLSGGGNNVDNSQYGPELSIAIQAYLFRFNQVLPKNYKGPIRVN